jgi:hypothetical protein
MCLVLGNSTLHLPISNKQYVEYKKLIKLLITSTKAAPMLFERHIINVSLSLKQLGVDSHTWANAPET